MFYQSDEQQEVRKELEGIVDTVDNYSEFIVGNVKLKLINKRLYKLLDRSESSEVFSSRELFYLYYSLTICSHKLLDKENGRKFLKLAFFYHSNEINEVEKGKLYIEKATNHFLYEELEEADESVQMAEEIFEQIHKYELLGKLYSEVLSFIQKIDSTCYKSKIYLEKFSKVITLFENEHTALYYNTLATSLINYNEDFVNGIHAYLTSLKLSKKYNNLNLEIINLYSIGTDYLELHEKYDESLRYLLPLMEEEKWNSTNYAIKCATVISVCYAYVGKNDYENAKWYFKLLPDIINSRLDDFHLTEQIKAAMLNLKAKVYFYEQTGESLLTYTLEAKRIYEKYRNHFRFIHFDVEVEIMLGSIYLKMNNYIKARTIFYRALNLAKLYERRNFIICIYKKLADTLEAMGDYKQACTYYKQYDELNIDWRREISITTYEAIHKNFETEQQDSEISFLQKLNSELKEKNDIDGLTQIYNRRVLDQFFKKSKVTSQPISFIMLDIDCFKLYNDNYGHLLGDEVLKSVAQSLKNICVRNTDKVIRYGGEEFIIILELTDEFGVVSVTEKIMKEIKVLNIPHLYSFVDTQITVSIGMATVIPKNKMDYYLLLEHSDAAMYHSKKNGRNTYTHFSELAKLQHINR